jgi:hypothetical protein
LSEVSAEKAKAAEAAQDKVIIDGLTQQATSITGQIAPIQSKLKFVQDIETYNHAYPQLFETVAAYTTPNVIYNSLQLAGTTLTLQAYCPNLQALGFYLRALVKCPIITGVNFSGVPGYRSAHADSTHQIPIPEGVPAYFPGVPRAITSFTVTNGKITAVTMQGQGTAGEVQVNNGLRQGPQMGFQMGGGQGARLFNPKTDGFDITVTCALNETLTPPKPPV